MKKSVVKIKSKKVTPAEKTIKELIARTGKQRWYPNFMIKDQFTQFEASSIIVTYPFYVRIKQDRGRAFYPVICGSNNGIMFTGEPHKKKNDCILLIKSWFPQVEIK